MSHKAWLEGDITNSGLYAIPLSDIDQIAYLPDKRKVGAFAGMNKICSYNSWISVTDVDLRESDPPFLLIELYLYLHHN